MEAEGGEGGAGGLVFVQFAFCQDNINQLILNTALD